MQICSRLGGFSLGEVDLVPPGDGQDETGGPAATAP